MKNPLRKRILRNMKSEIGKYLAIFLFMVIFIGFISGFIVADVSLKESNKKGFEKYNIENGNFTFADKLDKSTLKEIEKENKIKAYELFYKDLKIEEKKERELRIYKKRHQINRECLMQGKFPKKRNEIAIDRMFAKLNNYEVGDKIKLKGKKYKISALVAFSDYSTLFKSNSDMMFDANKFGVAITTANAYNEIKEREINKYAFKYNKKIDNKVKDNQSEEKKISDKMVKRLFYKGKLEDFTPRYLNNAIKFAGDDFESDGVMIDTLFYILIAIIAFIFAVTADNTVVKEANVIGTLRASGYKKSEIIRHYICSPMVITLISAIVGNILGYTYLFKVCADLYYNSYSLPTFTPIFSMDAFIKTTILPLILMYVVNYVILRRRLTLLPIDFIRRNLTKNKKKKSIRLHNFSFMTKFEIRVFLQNFPNYVLLFIGIFLANVLLFFGLALVPLLDNFEKITIDNMVCEYQVYLTSPQKTMTKGAEKFYQKTLSNLPNSEFRQEDISIMGVPKKSKYFKIKPQKGEVIISSSIAEKYNLSKNDVITLKEKYNKKKYKFKVSRVFEYPANETIVLNEATFCKKFNVKKENFTGYLTNKKIRDIDEKNILTIITKSDLTKMTRQLKTSMGGMYKAVNVFAIVTFMLIIFLLTKLTIEKNSNSISMLKILGYTPKEERKLYLMTTRIVVFFSVLLSLPITYYSFSIIYKSMMKKMFSGWMPLEIPLEVYLEVILLGMLSYFVVEQFIYKKIKKIPMDLALKNIE
ncbi:ABC transporter permease [Lachnobacterium bovis]|uniref:ABC transporter permease n=1 Tax=Lachnobacterium bovis TaxID=140626 RepID=UPI000483D4E6|nr:ABC transporter permease [Lachnobacterium bovis]